MTDDLETTRLVLRRWEEADAELLTRLATDPVVVRYVSDGRPWSADRVDEVAQAMTQHWREHDFGWRVVVPSDTDRAAGFVALNYLGEGTAGLDPAEFEIGWWLLPSVWRRGFATEAARAVCGDAFGRLKAPSLVARLQPENHASAAVATKLGMRHELDTTGRFGEPVAVYRLAAGTFLGQGGPG